MAEEYAHEAEEVKARQDADAAMARNIAREEAGGERQKRRGAARKSPTEELNDHVKAESERKLRCEARGDEYVPIPLIFMEDESEEENGPGQLRITEARERTQQHVQRMVRTEVEKKRKRQHEPPAFVEEDVCRVHRLLRNDTKSRKSTLRMLQQDGV